MRVKLAAIKNFLFQNRDLRQTATKNAFWLAAGNVIGRLIKAGLIIYVARELGAAGYGIFSYAIGLAGFFSLFSDIGVNGMLTREGARNPKALPEYLATSLVIKLGLLATATAVVIFLAPSFAGNVPEAVALLPLAALLIASDGLRDLTMAIPRAQEKMQTEAGISLFTNTAITILGIGAILWKATPLALMGGYTAGSVLGTIAAYSYLRENFRSPRLHFKKELILPILRAAIPFGLMGVLGALMLNTDTLMIGWLTTADKAAEALGLYGAAQRPVFVLYVIPTIISTTLFPAFSRLARDNKEHFRDIFEKSLAIAFLSALPFVVGGIILRQELMVLLFGPEFAAAGPAFAVLLLTMLTVFPGNLISNAIFAFDAQKAFVWYLAVGAVANAALNYALIPYLGILGCAISTIITQVITNAIIWKKLRSIQEFKISRKLYRGLAASLGMGIVVLALQAAGTPVLISVSVGAIIYLGGLYLLKEPLLQLKR